MLLAVWPNVGSLSMRERTSAHHTSTALQSPSRPRPSCAECDCQTLPRSLPCRQPRFAPVPGDEHVLDFGSGKLPKRFAPAVVLMMPMTEDEVTKERLEEILAADGITTSRDEDDDLVARALGESVHMMISGERQFVRFVKLVRVGPFVSTGVDSAGVQLGGEGGDAE